MPDKSTWFSTGSAAEALGISRDALFAALRAGAPEPQIRLAGRRVFGQEDLARLGEWFAARGRVVSMQDGRCRGGCPLGGADHE